MTGGADFHPARAAGGPTRLALRADALGVRDVGPWLVDLLAVIGPDEAAVLHARMELAVHEICMNVVDHAFSASHTTQPDDITLQGDVATDAVLVTVRDRGSAFDQGSVRPPVPGVPQIRGYGLLIAEKLADDIDYRREGKVNVWSLRFDRAPHQRGD